MKKYIVHSDFDIICAYEAENGSALSDEVRTAARALDAASDAFDENDTDENYEAYMAADKAFSNAFDKRKNAVAKWFDQNVNNFDFI